MASTLNLNPTGSVVADNWGGSNYRAADANRATVGNQGVGELRADALLHTLSDYDVEQGKKAVRQTDYDRPMFRRLWLMKGKNATFTAGKDLQVAMTTRNEATVNLINKQDDGTAFYGSSLHKSLEFAGYEWQNFNSYITLTEYTLSLQGVRYRPDRGTIVMQNPMQKPIIVDYFKEQIDNHRIGLEQFFEKEFMIKQCEGRGLPTSLSDMISTTPNAGTVGGIDRSVAANAYYRNESQTVTAKGDLWPTVTKTFEKIRRYRGINGMHGYVIFAGTGMINALRDQAVAKRQPQAQVGNQYGVARLDGHDDVPHVCGLPVERVWAMDDLAEGDANVDGDPTNMMYIVDTMRVGWKEAAFNPMSVYNPIADAGKFAYHIGKRWGHLAYARMLRSSAVIRYNV